VPDLALSISCPGGGADRSGTSGLTESVSIAESEGGTCVVTIAQPSGTTGTVSYVLTIDRSGG
jgi:hypothetical protein